MPVKRPKLAPRIGLAFTGYVLPDVELPELWRPCLRHVDLEVDLEIEAEPDEPDAEDSWFEAAPIEADELDRPRPRPTTSWFWS